MAYATKTSYMGANWLNLALAVGPEIGAIGLDEQAFDGNRRGWVTIAFGVWLFISPWVLRFTANSDAATNAYIVGILFAALGIWGAWAARKEISTHGTAQPMGR